VSVKAGSGKIERLPFDPYVWQRAAARLRPDGTDLRDQAAFRISDRVAEVFAHADAVRMAELDRLARLGPDPDEDTTEDPAALRHSCEVCGLVEGRLPVATRYKIDRPARLCDGCRQAGWRSSRCECGRPLHHRDYASNSKTGRIMGTRCGACRKRLREEFGYSNGRGAYGA
jgi:hypothetical protein